MGEKIQQLEISTVCNQIFFSGIGTFKYVCNKTQLMVSKSLNIASKNIFIPLVSKVYAGEVTLSEQNLS